MTEEFEIFRKDLIKMNLYKEVVLDNTASLEFILDNNTNGSDYLTAIHNEDVVMNRYGCFNISEEKNTGFITIRPALVRFALKIIIRCKQPFSETKNLIICRNGKTEIEKTYDITNCNSIELVADGEKYILKINYESEQQNTTQEIVAASETSQTETENIQTTENVHSENSINQTEENKENNTTVENSTEISQEKLDAIKAETEKDYESYSEKLEVLKEDYNFDKSLIEYYKDNDLVPIEQIFAELDAKIAEAEKQITLFIQARENKTKEIQES